MILCCLRCCRFKRMTSPKALPLTRPFPKTNAPAPPQILKYFSYEHFYVVYCKFWELDTDHDFLIDREDLLRYGNHALTYRIVDRIFEQASLSGAPCDMTLRLRFVFLLLQLLLFTVLPLLFAQAPRRFVCEVEGKMGYEDFCWFILSEEDKSSDISLEYWFKCVDLDCDGALRPNEMLVRAATLWTQID